MNRSPALIIKTRAASAAWAGYYYMQEAELS